MLNKEVIETFINDVNRKQNDVIYQTSMANAQWLKDSLIEVLQYIEKLEQGKEKAEWEQLCEECSEATKQAGLTKKDTDRIIKETRIMQWKAQKYDELIKKLEEDIRNDYHIESIIGDRYITIGVQRHPVKKYAQEILAILKGEKEV